jgi:hypothetical protein
MHRFIAVILSLLITLVSLGQSSQWEEVEKDFLLGKINYAADVRFKKLSTSICTKENAYLLTTVCDSLEKMISAAKESGINFKVISASRNFEQQKGIWEKKWLARKSQYPKGVDRAKNILLYSTSYWLLILSIRLSISSNSENVQNSLLLTSSKFKSVISNP